MRRARFLALVSTRGPFASAAVERLGVKIAEARSFARIWSGRRSVLYVDGPAVAIDHGAIVGQIFRRGSAGPLTQFSAADATLIAAGAGQFLIDAHWGGYVAVIERASDTLVLRAPLGDLPCLFAHVEGAIAIASDATLLACVTGYQAIDYAALARHLAAPDLRHAETCLAGVEELQGGLRLDVGDKEHRRVELWSPWRFAEDERQIHDAAEAQRRVRDAVLHAVAQSCRPHGDVILRLSGGLDSSVVAAALHEAGIAAHALNLITSDKGGDERRYARLVAETHNIHLTECPRRLAAVDLERSMAAHLPRPTARAFVQAALGPALDLATSTRSGAIIDGGGGDNVFCSLQSIRPVVDCLAAGQGRARARRTARTIASLSQVSEWTVLRRAWIARLQRTSAYRFPPDLRMLSAGARDVAAVATDHRWLDAPRGALPGKAAHIGILAAAQSVVEGFDPHDAIPLVSPLISQPVVEACLKVPSWLWYDRGLNRAVARDAFGDLLPRAIVERRSKGGPDSFIAELYRARRGFIRDHLLGGLLLENGLLDRAALTAALDERGPVQGLDFFRVMQLVDVESWARSR